MGGADAAGVPPRGAGRALLDAPASCWRAATDDAWLVEQAGGEVRVVASGPENLKVTTPIDLRLAEMLLAAREP